FTADGTGLFFHSRREGNWSIWRVNLDGSGLERITPKDVEAYTARAAAGGRWPVMAVERQGHRQIERLDLKTRQMAALTRDATDHWNPSVSPDGRYVVYQQTSPGFLAPNVEHWGAPPGTSLQVLRIAGAFPAFSPDGRQLALTAAGLAALDVM